MIKDWIVKQWANIKGSMVLYAQTGGKYDRAVNAVMRLPRPVAFFLVVWMFYRGWQDPAHMDAYAAALGKLPPDFYNLLYILLGSIAATKIMANRIPPQ